MYIVMLYIYSKMMTLVLGDYKSDIALVACYNVYIEHYL